MKLISHLFSFLVPRVQGTGVSSPVVLTFICYSVLEASSLQSKPGPVTHS